MQKIIVVSGGFDPIHSGHVSLLNHAKQLGDVLIVGLNSDAWLTRKKGRAFMPYIERKSVLDNLRMVDHVIAFDDTDGTAIDLLRWVKEFYPDDQIAFANGGDRTQENIPEMTVPDVEFIFGIGGTDKRNSSSWILQEWKAPKTERQWGYYRVLHEVPGMKVKELTVNPGCSLSMQRHFKRSEHWQVSEGIAQVDTESEVRRLNLHDTIEIPVGTWHRLYNITDKPCRIVEIQWGEACEETDIERKSI